jgi:chromosome partitioning protein
MILTIGNTKGGVGKTTLALNLAIARAGEGGNVLLIDADAQRSALTFTKVRTEQLGDPGYTAVALDGLALMTQVKRLAPNYDDVLIDCGGRDTGSLRAALMVSDLLLIPTQPRSLDLWAAEQMTALATEARAVNPSLRVAIVINVADAQGSDNADAAEMLREMTGLPVLPFTIGRRKAFANAVSDGRAVLEQTPRDPKAINELRTLVAALYTNVPVEA